MEMLVIATVVILAFGAVLTPLMRRRGDTPDEFAAEGDAQANTDVPTSPAIGTQDDVDAEIMRYRAAVGAGTVCRKCGQANPPGSRFCYECGHRLPGADAREWS